jgi:hypothetical protein
MEKAMVVVRCRRHEPAGRTRDYVSAKEPVGYPVTALVCGSVSCNEPGLIWLEKHEDADYQRGQRVFQAFTATMKMRAT